MECNVSALDSRVVKEMGCVYMDEGKQTWKTSIDNFCLRSAIISLTVPIMNGGTVSST